jgi:hypothetical protein
MIKSSRFPIAPTTLDVIKYAISGGLALEEPMTF